MGPTFTFGNMAPPFITGQIMGHLLDPDTGPGPKGPVPMLACKHRSVVSYDPYGSDLTVRMVRFKWVGLYGPTSNWADMSRAI